MGKSNSRPGIGIVLCVRRDNKVLLHQRGGKHAYGTWAFAGGHLEKWEEPEECALRELKEECGPDLKVTYPKFWTLVNCLYHAEGKHYLTPVYVSDWISGEARVMEPKKCLGWEWFEWSKNKLPQPLMLGTQKLFDSGANPFDFHYKP